MLREDHPQKTIGLTAPIRCRKGGHKQSHRWIANDLLKYAHWHKSISPVHLQASQLPDKIPKTNIRKPDAWYITTNDENG